MPRNRARVPSKARSEWGGRGKEVLRWAGGIGYR